MNKEETLQAITFLETKLLDISIKIKDPNDFSSMTAWLRYILQKDNEHGLAKYFLLPTEKGIKSAILRLITSNTRWTDSILELMSSSISVSIATVGDLNNHALKSHITDFIINNFAPLINLTKLSNSKQEKDFSIELIYSALKDNNLIKYKTNLNDPDIRFVLRALHVDTERNNKISLKYILNYILNELRKTIKQPNAIVNPRHAWWALRTYINESSNKEIKSNSKDLNNIIKLLISNVNSSYMSLGEQKNPNADVYEKIWITINAIKIYRHESNIFNSKNLRELQELINVNIKMINNSGYEEALHLVLCRSLLFYEYLGFLNSIEVKSLLRKEKIILKNSFIGKYLYEDRILNKYKNIKSSAIKIIKDKTILEKYTLSSMLISSSAGQGKSELIKQITEEFKLVAEKNGKIFKSNILTIGTEIKSETELEKFLENIKNERDQDSVQVIAFDEFDKANFDFTTPFLPFLEKDIKNLKAKIFWIFAQSTFPTFNRLKEHADSLGNKSLRDFLTRIKLGHIDIPDIITSPFQKVLSIIGMAYSSENKLRTIERNCIYYFADNEAIHNNRDLMKEYNEYVNILNCKALITSQIKTQLSSEVKAKNKLIPIIFN